VSVHQQRRQGEGVPSHTRRPVAQATQMQLHTQTKSAPGETRRTGGGDYQTNTVQFVSHQPMPSNYAQQPGHGSHILVSDGAISFVPSSNSSPVITSSSVASSYETAASGFEYLPAGESWNRSNRSGSRESLNAYGPSGPKRTGSGGSLNAYSRTDSSGQLHTQMMHHGSGQAVMPPSTSDNSINSRQRSVSYGSMGSLSGEGSGAQGYGAPPSSEQNNDWQNASNNPSQQLPQAGNRQWQYRNRVDGMPSASSTGDGQQSHFQDGRLQNTSRSKVASVGVKYQNRRRRPSEFDDDGLSMMTSALLNMMDTPEESAVDYAYDEAQEHSSHPVPQDQGPTYPNIPFAGNLHSEPPFELGYHQQQDDGQSASQYQDLYTANQSSSLGETETRTRWSPTWNGTQDIGAAPLEQNAQSISVIQQHQNAPASSHNPDVGLYLS